MECSVAVVSHLSEALILHSTFIWISDMFCVLQLSDAYVCLRNGQTKIKLYQSLLIKTGMKYISFSQVIHGLGCMQCCLTQIWPKKGTSAGNLLKQTSHREHTYDAWQCNLRKKLTRFWNWASDAWEKRCGGQWLWFATCLLAKASPKQLTTL